MKQGKNVMIELNEWESMTFQNNVPMRNMSRIYFESSFA